MPRALMRIVNLPLQQYPRQESGSTSMQNLLNSNNSRLVCKMQEELASRGHIRGHKPRPS